MISPEQLKADAAQQKSAPTDEQLQGVAFLAKKQQDLEKKVRDTEAELEKLQADLARVSELDLPDALLKLGMTEFKLNNGFTIKVEKQYFANIPSPNSKDVDLLARRMEAFKWLRDQGHGDLIKQQVVVECGREEDKAQRVINGLTKAGIDFKVNEDVHYQTLKAFVREQLESESEQPFPKAVFGAHEKRVAVVKAPKGKK
jgi:hypothetical protein